MIEYGGVADSDTSVSVRRYPVRGKFLYRYPMLKTLLSIVAIGAVFHFTCILVARLF
jgi:hypothetical protein